MDRQKGCLLIFFCVVVFWATGGYARTTSFNDISAQSIHAGTGTIEFRFKLLKDLASDPNNHVLLLGVSSDGVEYYKVEIIGDQLIIWRQFGGCLRAAFSTKYDFRVGDWHDLKLCWNKATTQVFLDRKEVELLKLVSTEDQAHFRPGIRLGNDDGFEIKEFKVSSDSGVSVRSQDAEFVANSRCPNVDQIMAEAVQESFRGIALRHFPDQASRDRIKGFITILPEGFARVLKNVVYIEDARFSKGGESGMAILETMSILLKGSSAADPDIFFHEAAHLYDNVQKINFGVSEEDNEWAKISGVRCYYKGANMAGFYQDFEKTKRENAFLGVQGGQCPSEDFAIWVAAAYGYYLKEKTFLDLLDPASPKFSVKNKKKIDFILRKGFITDDIYGKLTSR